MDVADICEAFGLGRPTGPPSFVARGELGRVSRLATTAGEWAVKEIELFVPAVEEADANVELQESMLNAGVNLPRPRRTVDGHGLFGNVRVYEWLDMTPFPIGDVVAEELVAASLARMHVHSPSTDRAPEHSPAKICHLDVCPENVFLCAGQLTVIDWENAGPAATLQDLGSTLWDFFRGDIERTRAFVDDYRRHGGPIERLEESVFDSARVVQANLIGFHARRALDPAASPETQERAEQGLSACLARPLTRQLVDAMVVGAPS